MLFSDELGATGLGRDGCWILSLPSSSPSPSVVVMLTLRKTSLEGLVMGGLPSFVLTLERLSLARLIEQKPPPLLFVLTLGGIWLDWLIEGGTPLLFAWTFGRLMFMVAGLAEGGSLSLFVLTLGGLMSLARLVEEGSPTLLFTWVSERMSLGGPVVEGGKSLFVSTMGAMLSVVPIEGGLMLLFVLALGGVVFIGLVEGGPPFLVLTLVVFLERPDE